MTMIIVLIKWMGSHADFLTAIYYFLYILFSSLDKTLFILYFAFCSKICDETYGGTYLTFLAVIYNFGHVWVKIMSFLILLIKINTDF